jgi:hypothetical protein
MQDRILLLGALLAFVAATAFLFVYFFVAGRAVRTGTSQTVPVIASILQDIDVWDQSDVEQYGALPVTETNSLLLHRKLAELFKKCRDSAITSGQFVAPDGLFHDAWGTPLIFLPTNHPDCEKLNPTLQGRPRFVVVWSAGRNKTNEFGFGDDVFSHR